jgi:glycosyltransferase involved in cell wall biosynthesis
MAKPKILLLSAGDINGAYEAVFRIAKFLKDDGHEVAMAVKAKTQPFEFVYEIAPPAPPPVGFIRRGVRKIMHKVWARLQSPKGRVHFDYNYNFLDEDETKPYYSVDNILGAIPFTPELVIVGMTNGFTVTHHLEEIHQKTNAKIFSLMVDMGPITGGCHFSWGCKGYTTNCNNCPAIISDEGKNYPTENLRIKRENLKKANVQIIAGSGWTYLQAKESSLYHDQPLIKIITGCIDTKIFNAKHRELAKSIFNIPSHYKLIFCGAQNVHDPRKGFSYFLDALKILKSEIPAELADKICILIAGRNNAVQLPEAFPFKIHVIEYIKDYRLLSLAYQAADIFVCPSVEDSGPLMVTEALACGTPVVGFEMGYIYDMVENGRNGYKAELRNVQDLANGLRIILELPIDKLLAYQQNAVQTIKGTSTAEVVVDLVNSLTSE